MGRGLVVEAVHLAVVEEDVVRLAQIVNIDLEHNSRPVEMMCDPAIAGSRNVHSVPVEVVISKASMIEPLPSFWTVRYHYS